MVFVNVSTTKPKASVVVCTRYVYINPLLPPPPLPSRSWLLLFFFIPAARIQQSTSVKRKDIRKFLDGIYVSEKLNIEVPSDS